MGMPATKRHHASNAVVYLFPKRNTPCKTLRLGASARANLFLALLLVLLALALAQTAQINSLQADTNALKQDVAQLAADTRAISRQLVTPGRL